MNNLDLTTIPEGMSIRQAATILLTKREDERRSLIFQAGLVALGDETEYVLAEPGKFANEVGAYVEALMNVAYMGTIDDVMNPMMLLASAVMDEEEAAKSWAAEPVETQYCDRAECALTECQDLEGCPERDALKVPKVVKKWERDLPTGPPAKRSESGASKEIPVTFQGDSEKTTEADF